MTSNCRYSKVVKYLVTIKCEQPMHVGSAEGEREEILLNPVTGQPFLQAYGIAGAMREYCRRIYGESIRDNLFGAAEQGEGAQAEPEKASKVKISDAIPVPGSYKTELRPHVKIDGKTGTVTAKTTNRILSGQKFEMQYVSAGACFDFEMYYFSDQNKEVKNNKKEGNLDEETVLEGCLGGIHAGDIQFGGHKSSGCGLCSIVSAGKYVFDLYDEEKRMLWFHEDTIDKKEFTNITVKLPNQKMNEYLLEMTGKMKQGLLVKTIVSLGSDHAFSGAESIVNGNRAYILPGTSLKGVFRNRVEMILDYLKIENQTSISDIMFGKEDNNGEGGSMGNVLFSDSIIREPKTISRSRIHIDKFTGGTFYGALFCEHPVSGEWKIEIRVKDQSAEQARISSALLILVFRDIAWGEVSFGSGAAVGQGFLDVSQFSIGYNGKKTSVDWNSKKIDGDFELIEECLKAVHCTRGSEYDSEA